MTKQCIGIPPSEIPPPSLDFWGSTCCDEDDELLRQEESRRMRQVAHEFAARRAMIAERKSLAVEREAFACEKAAFARERSAAAMALQEERAAFLAEKEIFKEERGGMIDTKAGASDVVSLSVGGEKEVSVLRSTLCTVEGSTLAARFSGRWDSSLPRDDKGRILLDVSPELFNPVLEYLRHRSIQSPESPAPPPQPPPGQEAHFKQMLKYWGLEDILPPQLFRTPSRFQSVVDSNGTWAYNGNCSDAIGIQVDRDVILHGVLVHGVCKEEDCSAYRGYLAVYQGETVLHRQDVEYTVGVSSNGIEPEPIIFACSPLLQAGRWYEVELCVVGKSSAYGTSGQARVRSNEGVTFTFRSSGRSTNNTHITCGQLPSFVYSLE